MNILFINGSPNSNGNTAALAKELLQGKEYETLNRKLRTEIGGRRAGSGHCKNGTGRGNCYRLSAVLAQHLRLSAKYAGSLLRFGAKRLIVGQNTLFPLSGRCAGKMDAGSRRIYDETLCRTLRNEICRYGNQPFRSG